MQKPKLTAKQDKFARLVAEGKTQADAYKKAYNASKMKSETIHKRASELALDGVVAGRIQELKAKFTKNLDLTSQITVERQLRISQKILQEALSQKDFNNSLKSLDFQTKLIGLYAPTKAVQDNSLQYLDKNGDPTDPPNSIDVL